MLLEVHHVLYVGSRTAIFQARVLSSSKRNQVFSTNGKLVVWVPVVWDSRGAPK